MSTLRTPLIVVVSSLALTLVAACQDSGRDGPSSAGPGASPAQEGTTTATPSSLTGEDLIAGRATFYGSQSGDSAAAIAAGDFNGDGALDLVLGAALADGPDDTRTEAGEAYLFLGPFGPGDERDASQGQQALTVYGASPGDQLARAVAAGDVNGDGIDDIILGAPFGDGPAADREDVGQTHILIGLPSLGRDTRFIDLSQQSADATVYGLNEGDLAGFALSVADINGDGTEDVIVGAFRGDGPQDSRPGAGEVYVLYGSDALRGTLDLTERRPDATVYGAQADDRLGEEVGAGDVNGDGVDDLVLPAPFASGPRDDRQAAGETYAIFGPPPAVMDVAQEEPDLTVYGVDPGDQLGHSLGVGDLNGDGSDDVLLAAVSANGLDNQARLAGEAAVVLGDGVMKRGVDVAAGGAATIIYAASAGDRLGRSAAVGDLDGDGLDELLIGAPGGDGADGSRPNIGEVYVVFGSPSLAGVIELGRGEGDAVIEGLDANDTLGSEVFGRPVLQVRDMDGDGRGDILVGAPRSDGPGNGGTDVGEGYILFSEGPR